MNAYTRPHAGIRRRLWLQAGLGAGTAVLAGVPAHAQDIWPAKAITLVVPFAAGGTTDIVARAVVQAMAPRLGQGIVVENVPGAGANIGAARVAAAAADGYTVLLLSTAHTINPALYARPGYSLASFDAVGSIGASPCWLMVGEKSPFRTMKELAAALKASPGKYSFASGGSGTTSHLAVELMLRRYGLRATHVPYRSAPQGYADIIAGTVDFGMNPVTGTDALVKSGRLRALAVGSDTRLAAFPDVPTFTEAGFPDIDVLGWFGLVVPRGTPAPRTAALEAALRHAADEPAVKATLLGIGTVAKPSSSEAFSRYVQGEAARWADLVAAIGVKAD